ncbi:MAG TPA: ABC transporter permease, partial [Burkholderiales bacterium]|nr:ABC transporter permease [Burkholderiales bacterium]
MLEARGQLTRRARVRLTVAAFGALVHACWLRKQDWSPTLVLNELKMAARALARRPGFTVAAVLTLALGIGANTAIFSVVYGVLLRPLSFRDPDRLVQLWETNPLRGWTEANVAPANLIDWRARNRVFEDIGFYMGSDTREGGPSIYTLERDGARQIRGLLVSVNLFDLLGVAPTLGRTFSPDMATPGNHRVVMLSHALWQQSFGGDPSIAGRKIEMGGASYEVAGVMPAWFRIGTTSVDLWAPLAVPPQWTTLRRPHFLRAIARLKPDVTVEQARGEIVRIMTDLEREYPDTNTQMSAGLGPLRDWFVGNSRRPLLVLLGAVGFVLLIACANVGSLVLARGASQGRELAIRTALGASRFRIARQLMGESVLIAAAGSALGLALAWVAVQGLLFMAPADLPRLQDVGLDWPVLLFTAGIGGVAVFLFGLAPALWASRLSVAHGSRTTAGYATTRRALIVAEVALAVVLLAGAGLMMRSLLVLERVNPGFNAFGLLTGQIALPGIRYDTEQKQQQFFEQVLDRARALPGVSAAGASRLLPLSGFDWTSDLFVEGREGSQLRELRHMTVTPGYFETIGLPLIAGRTYTRADDARAMPVIVVNETLARRAFPGENPIGRRITASRAAQPVWRTIIGVVGDEKQDALNEPTEPEIYWSHLQSADTRMAIVLRTSGDPLS